MKRALTAAYPLAFVALLGLMVVLGAVATSLLFSREPAYSVRVFGDAAYAGSATPGAIRPAEGAMIARGRIDRAQLLPLPAVISGRATKGDPVYESLAQSGAHPLLERARLAAQRGQHLLSTEVYRSLNSLLPDHRGLLVEHAAVLAAFDRHVDAAALLLSKLDRFPHDVELRFLAAQNLSWSDQLLAADSVLGLVLELQPDHAAALLLRHTIRPLAQPDLNTAVRWVNERNGPFENLLAARAYVRAQHYAAAVPHYRAALAPIEASDSLMTEAASAALAADSISFLHDITQRELAHRPDNVEALLRLARAYSWRGDYNQALPLYDRVLLLSAEPSTRLEKANVLMWAGREAEARIELEGVVAVEPQRAEPHKLLGDLAYYRGDWSAARRHYTEAGYRNAFYPGLSEARLRADAGEAAEAAARLAQQPLGSAESYAVTLDSYADNQAFRWMSLQGMRGFRVTANTMVNLKARHQLTDGVAAGSLNQTSPGFGFSVEAQRQSTPNVLFSASAGLDRFPDYGTFVTGSARITVYDLLGLTTALEYVHEPAVRRVLSLGSLQEHTMADAVRLTAHTTRGDWSLWSEVQAAHLGSRQGSTQRLDATASVTRTLTERLSARVSISALTTTRAAPATDWGPLYWSPVSYVEPTIGLQYEASLRGPLKVTGTLRGGAAFVREREGDRRFSQSVIPVASANLDVRYAAGAWALGVGAGYGGSLQSGYRAGSLRVQASYTLPR
jgi:tetratricopeptide (TPR) repeat protein